MMTQDFPRIQDRDRVNSMGMASMGSGLMTVEKFERAAGHDRSAHHELRRGELVNETRAIKTMGRERVLGDRSAPLQSL